VPDCLAAKLAKDSTSTKIEKSASETAHFFVANHVPAIGSYAQIRAIEKNLSKLCYSMDNFMSKHVGFTM
jgi:hypothetical protein